MTTMMKMGMLPAIVAGTLWLILTQATAQQVHAPGNYAPLSAPCSVQSDGNCAAVSIDAPLPVALRQENVHLALANIVSAATPLYGGTYIFNQTCTGYNGGMLALRYRSADASSMVPIISRSTSDTSNGTRLIFGSHAVVDVTLPVGSTGCHATLSRVP